MERRLEQLLERAVNGIERLAEDPVVQIEAGPPVCPACGVFNPVISVQEKTASGPMFEYLLQANCNSCGQKFYAVPEVWKTFLRREEVEEEMQERRGNGNRPT